MRPIPYGEALARLREFWVARFQQGYTQLARQAVRTADRALDRVRPPLLRFRRVAPAAMERAVGRMAALTRLHLYRGELYARGVEAPAGMTLGLMTQAEFEALSDAERARWTERLELDEGYCRHKWTRGDLVVVARLDDEPAGILWCARGPVYVPEIGRQVRPRPGECYIHDVYVTPSARGRAVAPAMLEFLARELRQRDVYRAWALIVRTNTASTRAFEKAAYASVADVLYVRMGLASRLLVRPPDPEAQAFLGVE